MERTDGQEQGLVDNLDLRSLRWVRARLGNGIRHRGLAVDGQGDMELTEALEHGHVCSLHCLQHGDSYANVLMDCRLPCLHIPCHPWGLLP